jgi:tRNA A37 threonylcarbamoyladenosine synthetase subunit TsaC/SUA5/YrdC
VLDGVDCVIDGDRCEYGAASTVVDLVDMQILRKGAGYERVVRCLR